MYLIQVLWLAVQRRLSSNNSSSPRYSSSSSFHHVLVRNIHSPRSGSAANWIVRGMRRRLLLWVFCVLAFFTNIQLSVHDYHIHEQQPQQQVLSEAYSPQQTLQATSSNNNAAQTPNIPMEVLPTTNDNSKSNVTVIIDIVSIGTIRRPEAQDAQQQTFGQHPSVRTFYRITEQDDTDETCHTQLTMEHVHKIVNFCKHHVRVQAYPRLFHTSQSYWSVPTLLERQGANPPGWVCAQKRPMDGLFHALNDYYHHNISLPDYLFLMDDDTYIPNMPAVLETIVQHYPSRDQGGYAVAGCRYRFPTVPERFTYPHGGFGTLFTKPVLEKLNRPIVCQDDPTADRTSNDHFVTQVCQRLAENGIGEQNVFRDGMTLGEMMHHYVTDSKYEDIDTWELGFCMHSDWLTGYLINYYPLSLPASDSYVPSSSDTTHRLMAYQDHEKVRFVQLTEDSRKRLQGCLYESHKCTREAHFCHRMTAEQMVALHKESSSKTVEQ